LQLALLSCALLGLPAALAADPPVLPFHGAFVTNTAYYSVRAAVLFSFRCPANVCHRSILLRRVQYPDTPKHAPTPPHRGAANVWAPVWVWWPGPKKKEGIHSVCSGSTRILQLRASPHQAALWWSSGLVLLWPVVLRPVAQVVLAQPASYLHARAHTTHTGSSVIGCRRRGGGGV
jgi:hypothetical protein